MSKHPPSVEWHVAESETEWVRLATQQADQVTPLVASNQPFFKNSFRETALLLVLLLALGGWWHTVQSRSQLAVPDVAPEQPPLHQPSVAPEYASLIKRVLTDPMRTVAPKDSSALTGIPTNASITLEPLIALVEIQGDWAVVSIVTPAKAGQLGCQEQRFYYRTAAGWQPIARGEEGLTSLPQRKTVSFGFGSVCH